MIIDEYCLFCPRVKIMFCVFEPRLKLLILNNVLDFCIYAKPVPTF